MYSNNEQAHKQTNEQIFERESVILEEKIGRTQRLARSLTQFFFLSDIFCIYSSSSSSSSSVRSLDTMQKKENRKKRARESERIERNNNGIASNRIGPARMGPAGQLLSALFLFLSFPFYSFSLFPECCPVSNGQDRLGRLKSEKVP